MSFRGKRLGNSAGDFTVDDALSNYSIPYKTAGGKVLWLPPGTAGQALKTVGSSIGWDTDEEGSAGGGSGGGLGYSIWDSQIPETATQQYEFDTNDLSAFTKIYITGETGVTVDAATTLPKGVYMVLPNQQYRWRSLVRALPGDTNWTIHSAVGHGFYRPDDSNISTAGILLADGATAGSGAQHACTLSTHAGIGWTRLQWNGYGNTASGASANTLANYERFAYLRLRKQSSVFYMAWSSDGFNWLEGTFTVGFTPTHFGIYGQNYSTTGGGAIQPCTCWFPYLRYFNVGTKMWTGAIRS